MDCGRYDSFINCNVNAKSFLDLITVAVQKPTHNDLGEVVESLTVEELDRFLKNLEKLIEESVVDINNDYENIYAATFVLGAMIDKKISPVKIHRCASLIHDNLLQFSDKNSYVQNCCCQLLERWWIEKLEKRKTFAVNVPSYILARALCTIGKMPDVSRLNLVKEMLALIDFRCLSATSLISLLCNAASNEMFLRNHDGVECLSYIITLDEELMLLVNHAIKYVIPDLKDAQLVKVGEVYYEAIELAESKGILQVYQKECLQSLVVSALHCHRVGPYKAAQNVLKVLSVLHRHKRESNIEEMLYDIYKPLLWRALDAPNGYVRANALSLFLDVFPLIPSNFPRVQFQAALEEQCSRVQELLKDDNETVRVCAVRGCAKVLDRFWEILPAHHLMSLLTTLCCDMTHDMGSSEVAVAALQGIQLLLNNPLTHVALKKLLPVLSNHIYHPATSVRNMFVSLLQTLHQTCILKFWDIVPAEEMLSVVGKTKPGELRKKIVSLLVQLYLPVNDTLSTQLVVTLAMLQSHPDIHRALYQDAYVHVGLSAAMKFVVALLSLVNECVDKGDVKISDESKLQISVEDTDKIGQILEICAILIASAHVDISRSTRAGATLSAKIVSIIPRILSQFGKNPTCCEAIYIIISNLPEEGLVTLKKLCYKVCKDMTANVNVLTSASLALLRIGGGNKILTYWSDSIARKLQSVVQSDVANPASSTPIDLPCPHDDQLLHIISSTLDSELHQHLLACSQLDTLYCTLLTTCHILPHYHHTSASLRLRADRYKYLVTCLALAARFSIHIGGVDDMTHISDCIWDIVEKTRSGNSLRTLLIEEVFPVIIEGFLVLQYNATLLSVLYKISSSLGESELAQQRLSLCKYLYRAGTFAGQHHHPDVDLRSLFLRVLKHAASRGVGCARKELRDVECLLLEVMLTAHKQLLAGSKFEPWSGVVEDVLVVVRLSLGRLDIEVAEVEEEKTALKAADITPFLHLIIDCIEVSETFSRQVLPVLELAALQEQSADRFIKLVRR